MLTDEERRREWNASHDGSPGDSCLMPDARCARFVARIEALMLERIVGEAIEIAKWHVACADKQRGLDDEDVRECAQEIVNALERVGKAGGGERGAMRPDADRPFESSACVTPLDAQSVRQPSEPTQDEAEIERLLVIANDDIGRVRVNSSAGINHGAAQLAALARRLLRQREIARKHAREHHLEACETCVAIESERNAERDSRKVQEGMTQEAVRQRDALIVEMETMLKIKQEAIDEARRLHDAHCPNMPEPCEASWSSR